MLGLAMIYNVTIYVRIILRARDTSRLVAELSEEVTA